MIDEGNLLDSINLRSSRRRTIENIYAQNTKIHSFLPSSKRQNNDSSEDVGDPNISTLAFILGSNRIDFVLSNSDHPIINSIINSKSLMQARWIRGFYLSGLIDSISPVWQQRAH
jgi:hypothetical protein